MASLESLKDPLARLGVLGTAGSQSASWRRGEVGNTSDWDETKQYYLNDMVFSAIDGGAYVMTGGPTGLGGAAITAVKGGDDPALAWVVDGSVWEPLATYGPRVLVPGTAAQQTASGAANVITFLNCDASQALLGENVNFGASANYMAHIQCTVTHPLVNTSADYERVTFTPNGTGPVARSLSIQPLIGATDPNSWSGQLFVEVPADATGIAVTGAYNGQLPTITNLRVIYTPVVQ
jgi:hypothetical protein